jgi:hypothetical protein
MTRRKQPRKLLKVNCRKLGHEVGTLLVLQPVPVPQNVLLSMRAE